MEILYSVVFLFVVITLFVTVYKVNNESDNIIDCGKLDLGGCAGCKTTNSCGNKIKKQNETSDV